MGLDIDRCITLKGQVTFKSNTAEHGRAVCVSQSIIMLMDTSVVILNYNKAIKNGGGLYFSNQFAATFGQGSTSKFINNTAH